MNGADRLYRTLLGRFGTQGWWPTTPRGKFEAVYHAGPRVKGLSEREQFEICAGAILTQNTAWTNVRKALSALHRARVMSPERIVRTPFGKLSRLIRSSGYFRQKAKKLKIFARHILERHGGRLAGLFKKPLREAREELLSLHGLGPETADSMLLYAGGLPVFVVDAYTRRVGRRMGFFKTDDYAAVQDYFMGRLPRSAPLYNEFHALFVALGKDFCRTQPLCLHCPARKICKTGGKTRP